MLPAEYNRNRILILRNVLLISILYISTPFSSKLFWLPVALSAEWRTGGRQQQ